MKSAAVFAFRFVVPPVAMIAFVVACWRLMAWSFAACSHSYGNEAIAVRRSWLRRRLGLEPGRALPRQGFLRDKRGSIAIEGALLIPILILAAVGGCDAGLAILHDGRLQWAAQQAAIVAAAGGDYAALFAANMGDDGSSITCTTSAAGSSCDAAVSHQMLAGALIGFSVVPMTIHTAAAPVHP